MNSRPFLHRSSKPGHASPMDAAREVALARRVEAGVFARRLLSQPSVLASLLNTTQSARPNEQARPRSPQSGVLVASLLNTTQSARPYEQARRRSPQSGVLVDATPAELRAVSDQGDAAWCELLTATLPLVRFLAQREARRSGQSHDELFQQGCVGLIEALQRFDHRRGVRFSSFAAFWVKAHMFRVNDHGAPTAGAAKRAYRRSRARRAEAELSQRLGRRPTTDELAQQIGTQPGRLTDPITVVPLHDPDGRDLDVPDPRWQPGRQTPETTWHLVRDLLGVLPAPERAVVMARFGLGEGHPSSCDAAAQALGLSVSVLRRIETTALRRLRDAGAAVA